MSLLEFRSPACGGFFMKSEDFATVCKAMDREFSMEGCLLPEDIAPVLKRLEDAVAREKELIRELDESIAEKERAYLSFEEEQKLEEAKTQRFSRVSLGVRSYPFADMMRQAVKKNVKVMWGVP